MTEQVDQYNNIHSDKTVISTANPSCSTVRHLHLHHHPHPHPPPRSHSPPRPPPPPPPTHNPPNTHIPQRIQHQPKQINLDPLPSPPLHPNRRSRPPNHPQGNHHATNHNLPHPLNPTKLRSKQQPRLPGRPKPILPRPPHADLNPRRGHLHDPAVAHIRRRAARRDQDDERGRAGQRRDGPLEVAGREQDETGEEVVGEEGAGQGEGACQPGEGGEGGCGCVEDCGFC